MALPYYTPTQKILHWTFVVLVLFMYCLAFVHVLFQGNEGAVYAAQRLHISVGLFVAVLVIWRIILRLLRGAPEYPKYVPLIPGRIAKLGHLVLYLLLIAIPTLGILLVWSKGYQLSFFGLFTIPAPFQADESTAHMIKNAHRNCATSILILAAVHGLSGLYHHFFRRDGILARMLPGGSYTD